MKPELTDVIRRPLVTEKTTVIREDGRTIVFQVATDANKIDIRHAVEQLLGSKVESIRTALAHGKMKRQGRFAGRRSDWKKAYVRLREGEKIPEFLQGRRLQTSPGARSPKPEPARIRQCRSAHTNRPRRAAGSRRCRCSTRSPPSEPYKPLTEPLNRSGGRNNHGELTSWWRGGGHKRLYRVIDFKRDKKDIPATVSTIEYDPNRSARIALVTYADGEKRYILQPLG